MKQRFTVIFLFSALFASVHAVPSQKFVVSDTKAAAHVENDRIIQNFVANFERMEYPRENVMRRFDGAFEDILQDMAKAEDFNEDYKVDQQIDENLHSSETDKQLKGVMLVRMQRMYESMIEWMENYNSGHQQQHATKQDRQNYFKVTTQTERTMDEYLQRKVTDVQLQSKQQAQRPESFHRNNVASSVSLSGVKDARIMSNEATYLPIFKFDGAAVWTGYVMCSDTNYCVVLRNVGSTIFIITWV